MMAIMLQGMFLMKQHLHLMKHIELLSETQMPLVWFGIFEKPIVIRRTKKMVLFN